MNKTKLIFTMMLILAARMGQVNAQSMFLALEGEEWKEVKDYPVKGKQGLLVKEKLSFGDYRTLDVDRSWTKGSEVTTGLTVGVPTDDFYKKIITTDKIHKKQTLFFALGDSHGNQSTTYSVSQLDAKDFNIGNSDVSVFNLLLDLAGPGAKSSNVSYSRIYVGPSAEGWDLFIDNQAAVAQPKKYMGYLAKNDTEFYTITPVTKVKNKKGKVGAMPFGSVGFEIRSKDGEALAAVSVIDNGIIYLKETDPQEQLLLASACAALLLRPEDL